MAVPAPASTPGPLSLVVALMSWQDDVSSAMSAGPWTESTMLTRVSHAIGRLSANGWVQDLVSGLLAVWPSRPELQPLHAFLAGHAAPVDTGSSPPPLPPPPPAAPVKRRRLELAGAGAMPRTRADLLSLLDLTQGELDWFADRHGRSIEDHRQPLRHYRHRVLTSGDRVRVLEIPKPRMKEIQRRLLRHVTDRIPLHPAAHGAAPGRSVGSAVGRHAGSAVLIRCDIESFFAAITDDRVCGLLRMTGTKKSTARLMAALCTTVLPASVRAQLRRPDGDAAGWRLERRLATPHLPQGAPTSPSLANAIAYSLDVRLDALARSLDGRYTRYVDDLIFSGGPDLRVGALLGGVRSIAADEGFRLGERKTTVLRSSQRQQVLGVVLNAKPSIRRDEMDRLRATRHNCRTRGVASRQCRQLEPAQLRAQLIGKIAWVNSIDPHRGQLLSASLERIDWQS